MAQSIEKTKNEMLDELFQAIDVITTKRLEHLEFDKTITCQIIDISNSDKGEYTVSDGMTEFLAYSENTNYREGSWVYVTIPNGDFTQVKYIVGKYISDNTEYSTYVNPFDTYIDITGNLLTVDSEEARGLIANNPARKEMVIWRMGELSLTPQSFSEENNDTVNAIDNVVSETTQQFSKFDRLGIRASFKTLLGKYDITSGNYGLRLDIIYMDPGSTASVRTNKSINIKLDSDNMFGNPYNFITWSQQQFVFDISDLDNIIGMQFVFYQDNNFVNKDNERIPLIDSENEIEWNAYLSMANILVQDIYISLGYDLQGFDQDQLLLYSFEPLTYASYLVDSNRELLSTTHPELNLNNDEDTQIALQYVNEKNLHLRWVHFDENEDIVAIDNIDDIEVWENDDYDEVPLAKVHWYRWKLEDGIEDSLAGVFWQEQNGEDSLPDLRNSFNWTGFQPNPMTANEKVKTIIEYPSLEYLEYTYRNSIDDVVVEINAEVLEREELEEIEFDQDLYCENIAAEIRALSDKTLQLYTTDFQKAYLAAKEYFVENPITLPHPEVDATILGYYREEQEQHHINFLNDCDLYESEILQFENEHDVPDLTSIELIRGLKIECDADPHYGLNGVYHIYNTNGQIMNTSEASKLRFLSAQFDKVVTGDVPLDRAEIIKWYFPVNSTMIELPVEGCEYTILEGNEAESHYAVSAGLDDSGEWFCIERQGVQVSEPRAAGEIIPTELDQIFRIKSYYTQSAINNTVRCELYKNNKTYSAEYTMYFGVSGSNGTDYTLTVTYEEYTDDTWTPGSTIAEDKWQSMVTPVFDWLKGPIKLVPHVFDYENIEITDEYQDNSFTCEWFASPQNAALSITASGKDFIIERNDSITKDNYYHFIAKITVNKAVNIKTTNDNPTEEEARELHPDWTDEQIDELVNTPVNSDLVVDLTTYCPITVRFDETIFAADGDNKIIYDPSGVNPTYYKGQYALYRINSDTNKPEKQENISWSIETSEQDEIDTIKYYPQIDATSGELIVPSMFMSGNKPEVSILASEDGSVVWCQPLYIYQEIYASTMLNSWDGSLTIDEDNGTIMSAMMGAGYKDDNNLFNGVLMGNVAKKIGVGKSDNTGIFGYNQGEQSFGWKIDGTGFIGKSGHGQILLNGNTGEIQSATWNKTYTDPTTQRNFKMSGMRIDLDDAFMDLVGTQDADGQAKIHIGVSGTTSDPYFKLVDDTNNTLLLANNDDYYLQTSNYKKEDPDTGDLGAGVQFDLKDSKLIGYDFVLKALHRGAEDTYDTGVTISSGVDEHGNSQPYIKVVDHASYDGATGSQTVLYIGPSSDGDDGKFYLKSSNYSTANETGLYFNITEGYITAYDFKIKATSSDGLGAIIIDSGASTTPLKIGTNFSVTWAGHLAASAGNIGGWRITDNALFSDAPPSNGGTYSGVALYSYSADNENGERISVGAVTLSKVNVPNDTDYDDDGNPINGGTYEDWNVANSDNAAFVVTRLGELRANKAIFPNCTVSGNFKITGNLYYKGKLYKRINKTVVTGVSGGGGSVTYKRYKGISQTSDSPVSHSVLSSSTSWTVLNGWDPSSVTVYDHKYQSNGSEDATVYVTGGGVSPSKTTLHYLGT